MAINGEPKNGDYARYVEDLVNRGRPSPGQILDESEPASVAPSPGQVLKPPKASKPGPQASISARRPAAGAADATNAPHTALPSSSATAADKASLAARAVKRRIGVGMTIAGLLVGWAAVRMFAAALREPVFDAGELIPVAFVLVAAGMLLRGARSLRADSRKPLRKLTPLSTVSGRPSDKS